LSFYAKARFAAQRGRLPARGIDSMPRDMRVPARCDAEMTV
jgi:hypothetical protein